MVLCGLFAALTVICSWVSIPVFHVTFTLQTFAVFLSLLLLGGRQGMTAICVYLVMGAVGLPVFAGFQGGMGVLAGAYGGYIVGFMVIAMLFRLLAEEAGEKRRAAVLVLGLAACYAFGTVWFVKSYAASAAPSVGAAVAVCVLPFILPDLGKLALALFLTRRVKKLIK